MEDIQRSVYNRNQSIREIPIFQTCITDISHEYILYETMHQDQIGFERQIYTGNEYE